MSSPKNMIDSTTVIVPQEPPLTHLESASRMRNRTTPFAMRKPSILRKLDDRVPTPYPIKKHTTRRHRFFSKRNRSPRKTRRHRYRHIRRR